MSKITTNKPRDPIRDDDFVLEKLPPKQKSGPPFYGVKITHTPTGFFEACDQWPTQYENLTRAKDRLIKRIMETAKQ